MGGRYGLSTTVTLLFTDIVESTRSARAARRRLRDALASHRSSVDLTAVDKRYETLGRATVLQPETLRVRSEIGREH